MRHQLDQLERIVWDSEFSAACLGKVTAGDRIEFMFFPLNRDGAPLDEEQLELARQKGLVFAGVYGFKDNVADAKCEEGPDALRVMCAACPAFISYLAQKLKQRGDAVDWLEKLHRLPDTRTAN
jgi:hypothetical protein